MKKFFYIAFIFSVVAIALLDWLNLSINGLGNDNFNLAYPLRVLLSTSIQNGIFPLWDHWTFGGAPSLSIYSTIGIAPIPLLLSCFGIYSPQMFWVEIILVHLCGFFGMYFWLQMEFEKWIALFGSLSFALCVYFSIQMPINLEGIGSPAFYPWLAGGLSLALRGKSKGVSIAALALYFMFTTGYLGTNLFACQIIFVFCFVLNYSKTVKKGVALAALSLVLFLGSINLLFFETFANQPLRYFTHRDVDPFTASMRGRSFITFLFPNGVSPFESDRWGGHFGFFYIGVISVFFIIYSIIGFRKNRLSGLFLLFSLLVYLAVLSSYSIFGRLSVELIPFYKKIRFHVWNSILVSFFSVYISSYGMQAFFGKYDHVRVKKTLFFFCVFFLICWFSLKNHHYYFPQIALVPLSFLVLFNWVERSYEVKIAVLIVLLLSDAYVVRSEIVKFPGINPSRSAVNTQGFPAPNNLREVSIAPANEHYFSKIPHVFGYMPQIHPTIDRLQKVDPQLTKLRKIFEAVDSVKNIRIQIMDPRKIETMIELSKGQYVTWSSPFSENWQLNINGQIQKTIETEDGLTRFYLPAGTNQVRFFYMPRYFYLSVTIMILSLLFLVVNLVYEEFWLSLFFGYKKVSSVLFPKITH